MATKKKTKKEKTPKEVIVEAGAPPQLDPLICPYCENDLVGIEYRTMGPIMMVSCGECKKVVGTLNRPTAEEMKELQS